MGDNSGLLVVKSEHNIRNFSSITFGKHKRLLTLELGSSCTLLCNKSSLSGRKVQTILLVCPNGASETFSHMTMSSDHFQ